jgi:hypothetical protein
MRRCPPSLVCHKLGRRQTGTRSEELFAFACGTFLLQRRYCGYLCFSSVDRTLASLRHAHDGSRNGKVVSPELGEKQTVPFPTLWIRSILRLPCVRPEKKRQKTWLDSITGNLRSRKLHPCSGYSSSCRLRCNVSSTRPSFFTTRAVL